MLLYARPVVRLWHTNEMCSLLIIVIAIFVLIPVVYMLLISVTPDIEVNNGQWLPSHWAFENYVQMWSTINLAQGLWNSTLISMTASTIAVFLAVGAAYVITRFHFRGRVAYLYSLVGLQAIPGVMLLLPLFVLFISIQSFIHAKLVGTYTGVIITYLTFSLPFATWLLVTYLGNIPLDIEEAALIDGATRLQVILYIIFQKYLIGGLTAGSVKG